MNNQNLFFYILIRHYKSFVYFDKCIDSIFSQSYKNYKILFLDDNSKYSKKQIGHIRKKLRSHICVFNKVRKYSLKNAHFLIHKFATKADAVVFNLDGDDWLLPNALDTVSKVYKGNPNCLLTYGECSIWNGNMVSKKPSKYLFPPINIRYDAGVVKKRLYRLEPFLPLHPRTWKVSLFKSVSKKEFLDSTGKWLRFAEDQAMFFPMLEKINTNYEVIKKPIYVYNKANPHADISENTTSLLKDEIEIRKKHSAVKKYDINERKICIYYNRTLSLPLINSILYSIQIQLLRNNLTNNIFVSLKDSKLRDKLLNSIVSSWMVIVKSPRLLNLITTIVNYKVFDCPSINLEGKDVNYLYEIEWILMYCDSVTKNTKLVLNKLLPANYPTF